MTWADDRARDQTPAPRENYCLDCGKYHERRPFLEKVLPEHLDLYKRGLYKFPTPPVPTLLWDAVAWCRWIDGHGTWIRTPAEFLEVAKETLNATAASLYIPLEPPSWPAQLEEARKLPLPELERHASVSSGNRHRCEACFCCAALSVLEERQALLQ